MRVKHTEIEIHKENPFANCKLEREQYAKVLTTIIESYSHGFVLAINNKWGTGKTTFVKMWEQYLKNKEFQTLYFNAWENDFENNPLTALMGELKTLTKKSTETKFKSTLKKAAILSKHVAPIVAKTIVDKYVNTDSVKSAIVGVTEGLVGVFENNVNEYSKKKHSISDFRDSLSEFISNTGDGKPLIFIVDELDRCRPDYAVSILEQIKHFFSIPNAVFVLSIDKTQLGNAIKGVYGSESLDADEYLRRFIDLEYSIPEPNSEVFYEYLYDYFQFNDFFKSDQRSQINSLSRDGDSFLRICKVLFTNRNIPLRQQEKIFALARLALRSFRVDNFVIPHTFIYLIFIKFRNNKFYEELKDKQLSIVEAQSKYLDTISLNLNEESESELIMIEAYLLIYYQNYIQPSYNRDRLYEWDSEKQETVLLVNSIINKEANNDLLRYMENIYRYDKGNLDLGYFTNRIELLEFLKT